MSEKDPAQEAWFLMADGHAIFVEAPFGVLEACVGMPLSNLHLSIVVNGGARIDGFGVELSGPALDLLSVTSLDAYRSDDSDKPGFRQTGVPFEVRAGGLFAALPGAVLDPGPALALFAETDTDMEPPSGRCTFGLKLHAHARAAGRASLVVRVTDLSGGSLDANEKAFDLAIAPAPRLPVLPSEPLPREARALRGSHENGAAADAEAQDHYRRSVLLYSERYSGDSWLVGWLGFDGAWRDLGPLLLAAAAALGAELPGKAQLALDVSEGGGGKALGRDARLSDREGLVACLAATGSVHLKARDGSFVGVVHGARESEFLGKVTTVVPISMTFSIQRPRTSAKRARLGVIVDRLFAEAGGHPAVVGGFAAPAGYALMAGATAYERLAGIAHDEPALEVIRRRPRSPGWRVIVPHAALGALDPGPGVTSTEGSAGRLLRTSAAEPFAMTDAERDAIERALVRTFAK
jgi:hypothetical protein